MPITKAEIMLSLLREFKDELFTHNILLACEAEHARLVREKIIDDLRATSEKAVLDAIEEIIAHPVASEARSLFDTFPRTIQVFLFERFFYFEAVIVKMGEREFDFPMQFELFLRWGLIQKWNVRKERGWFF